MIHRPSFGRKHKHREIVYDSISGRKNIREENKCTETIRWHDESSGCWSKHPHQPYFSLFVSLLLPSVRLSPSVHSEKLVGWIEVAEENIGEANVRCPIAMRSFVSFVYLSLYDSSSESSCQITSFGETEMKWNEMRRRNTDDYLALFLF